MDRRSSPGTRYRRQILALKQFFEGRDCTTLLLDERFRDNQENQVQTFAHGVISLEVLQSNYGATRRRLEVLKVWKPRRRRVLYMRGNCRAANPHRSYGD